MRCLTVVNALSTAFCKRVFQSFRRFELELELKLIQSHIQRKGHFLPNALKSARFWTKNPPKVMCQGAGGFACKCEQSLALYVFLCGFADRWFACGVREPVLLLEVQGPGSSESRATASFFSHACRSEEDRPITH